MPWNKILKIYPFTWLYWLYYDVNYIYLNLCAIVLYVFVMKFVRKSFPNQKKVFVLIFWTVFTIHQGINYLYIYTRLRLGSSHMNEHKFRCNFDDCTNNLFRTCSLVIRKIYKLSDAAYFGNFSELSKYLWLNLESNI